MATLIYSKPSLQNIEDIKNFIASDSVANAHRFIKAVRTRITLVKKYPGICNSVLPMEYKDLHQVLYKSYGIIYQLSENEKEVKIITVHHQPRRIKNSQGIKDYKDYYAGQTCSTPDS